MEQTPSNDPMFNYLDAYYEILNEMKQKMTSAKQTANISWDFITQMIPHRELSPATKQSLVGASSQLGDCT